MTQFGSAGFQNTDISILLPDEKEARIVENLKASEPGSLPNQVKTLTSKETNDTRLGGTEDVAAENTAMTQGAGAGAGIGAVIGSAALGWVATLTALAIPGLGLFLVVGPLIGALAGGAAGGAVGGLVGTGIPESEAKLYEARLKKGDILVSVHTDAISLADRARSIFRQTGATDIATTPET